MSQSESGLQGSEHSNLHATSPVDGVAPEILFLASRHPIATLKRLFHSRQAIITRYLHSNLCMHDLRLLVSQHGPGRNRVIRFVDSKGTVTWTFNARGRSALSSPIIDSYHISEYLLQPHILFLCHQSSTRRGFSTRFKVPASAFLDRQLAVRAVWTQPE